MIIQPLQSDQSAKEDALDRKRFASRIAASILNHIHNKTESLVIGIHGAWGSGKSTLLDFIKEDIITSDIYKNGLDVPVRKYKWLQKWNVFRLLGWNKRKVSLNPPKKLFILEFNPWMFSGKEQLHRKFLSDFARKVGSQTQEIRDQIEKFSTSLSWTGATLPGAMASGMAGSFASISVEELKEETNKLLIDEDIHVVIIIDDLDRLAPSEMLEIFQLVKLNANFSNTLFLLSFDKGIVKDSITHQYKFNGERYLEKIIQVDYNLPYMLPEEVESMFFKRLQEFVTQHDIDFDTTILNTAWLFHGLKQYFNTIRDLNRYFNSLGFRLPPLHKDINVHDFLLIEVIRLFDFETYEIIKNHFKEAQQYAPGSHHHDALRKIDESTSRYLYKYLLKVENQNVKLKDNSYRIFDLQSFDRYFSLTNSKKDVYEDDFNSFIYHPPVRDKMLENAIKHGKIDYLLRRLGVQSELHERVNFSDALTPLFTVWVGYPTEFAAHWREAWTAIKFVAFSHPEKRSGVQLIIDQVTLSTSDFSPARFVFLWFMIENSIGEDIKNVDPDLADYKALIKDETDKLESTWKMLLEKHQTTFTFSEIYPVLYERIFLPSFAKYHSEKYEQQFDSIINDNKRVFKILNMFVFRDSSTQEPFGIDPKHIERLLPEKLKVKFVERLRKINRKPLSENDAKTVDAFLGYLDQGSDPLRGRRKVYTAPSEVEILKGGKVTMANAGTINSTIMSAILGREEGVFSIWGYVSDIHYQISVQPVNMYLVGYATNGGQDLKNPSYAKYPNSWAISRVRPTSKSSQGQWRFHCNGVKKPVTDLTTERELAIGWHLFSIAWSVPDNYIKFVIDSEVAGETEFKNWPSSDSSHSIHIGVWPSRRDDSYFKSNVGHWQFVPSILGDDALMEMLNEKPE